jgi:hypothetical protein
MTNIMDTREALRAIYGSADKITTKVIFGGIDLTESSTIQEENDASNDRVKMFLF